MKGNAALERAVPMLLVVGGLVALLSSCSGQRSAMSADPLQVTGRFTASALGLHRPSGLAIAPNGNLYVTDFSMRVTVISPEGQVLNRWGVKGSGPGQFRFVPGDASDPEGVMGHLVVAPDGTVYVADSGNGRVEAFTADGRFLRSFGSFGTDPGQLIAPFDVVVDPAGDVYVADDQALTLSKFASNGKFLWSIGTSRSDPDLVGHFHFSMIDSHRRIVFTIDDIARVVYLDESGHKVDAFGGTGVLSKDGPCDVSVDPHGYTYVTPCGPGATFVFDRRHQLAGRWDASHGILAIAPRFGRDGAGFAFDWDGSLVRFRPTLGRP